MKAAAKLAGISAVLFVISTSANAIVTSWDYTVESVFTFAGYSNGSNSGPISTSALSWGTSTGSGQSSLTINGSPTAGAVDTFIGGGSPPQVPPYLGLGSPLTHDNNPIEGTSLTSAVLTNKITLDPTSPNNPPLAPFDLLFTIAFTETTNSAPCAVVTSPTPCNDIFVLTSGLQNYAFDYDDGTGLSTYFINIFPATGGVLSVLTNAACAAAGVGNGCLGFSTPENEATTLAFGFAISTERLRQEVPEPGALALFGLGLFGLFFTQRRLQPRPIR